MRFGSFASGIEAASVAWKPLGMRPAFFSEIDKFCCSLLAQRHDDAPNLGDMNEITTHALRRCGKLDIVIAGTPCQAFSVAGNRGGITDPRGQLALRLLDMVEYTRPRWVVWENVPGVLSSWTGPNQPSDLAAGQEWEAEETSDFGCFLEALSHLGYGWAYRVYDAQFSGVPQRRRRVFLVGYLGDWTRAARVLFEPHCVSGDTPKGGKAGENITGTLTFRTRGGGGLGTDFECAGGLVASLTTKPYADNEEQESKLIPVYTIQERAVSENINNGPGGKGYQERIAYTLEARHHVQAVAYQCHGGNVGPMGTLRKGNGNATGGVPFIAHTLRAEGFDASEDGTGRGTPLVPIVMAHGQAGAEVITGQCPTLTCNHEAPILFSCKDYAADAGPVSPTLRAMGHNDSHANAGGQVAVLIRRAVRRLTPRECERLMGLPDDYTLITYRGKPACDGPRYKSIGNSIAIPDLRWIGQRIREIEGASN